MPLSGIARVSGRLRVPGAMLYYESRGSGREMLLLLHASGSSTAAFDELSDALASRFRVLSFDRRHHGRSVGHDSSAASGDHGTSVARHCLDCVALLDALGVEQADVFGTSAGAVVALELASVQPGRLGTVVLHEPPLFGLLPNGAELRAAQRRVHEIYARDGAVPAAAAFLAAAGNNDPPPPLLTRLAADFDAGFHAELLPIAEFTVDPARLKAVTAGLVIGIGTTSPESPGRRAARALADLLGQEPVGFPGNHFGYSGSQPSNDVVAFATKLGSVIGAPTLTEWQKGSSA